MNLNGILEAAQHGAARVGQRLVLAPDADFASTLTLGQVIKGKVLRHYEGSRYAVSFNGQEKVVDSSVPLRTGELLYGRVVGLDDKVQLQRVFNGEAKSPERQPQVQSAFGFNASPLEEMLSGLFERYQSDLKAADVRTLVQLMRSVPQPDLMALSGLVLSKIGLRMDPMLVRSLYRALHSDGRVSHENVNVAVASESGFQSNEMAANGHAVEQLAASLASRFSYSQQTAPDRNELAAHDGILSDDDNRVGAVTEDKREQSGDSEARQEWQLGRFLLNVQSDGSVTHRIRSFPLWFGDRLVEIDVALFSQKDRDTRQSDGIRYRKLVFSLQTEYLGRIEVAVYVANQNLRVAVTTESESTTDHLARYMPDLKGALADSGWQVDEFSYQTADADLQGNVVRSVVEHYISQDSLSRLM